MSEQTAEAEVQETVPEQRRKGDPNIKLVRNPSAGDLAYTALFEHNESLFISAEARVQEGAVLGGGHRVGPKKLIQLGGEEMEVREIITMSAGGTFTANDLDAPTRAPENRPQRLEAGYEMWKKDPMGGQIVLQTTNFTFGSGHKVTSPVERVRDVIKKFDRKNGMGRRFKRLSDESVAYGEIFLKLVPHREDIEVPGTKKPRFRWRKGQTQVVPIDPANIVGIDHAPDNVEDITNYIFAYEVEENGQKKQVEEKIPPIDKFDFDSGKAAMIHLKLNDASNDVFGTSDLLRVAEWVNKLSEYNRDSFIINKLYRSPMIDITIIDGDETDVRRAIRRYQNFEIGSNPVHNDKEKWDILEFTGANVSQMEARRALLLMIATGVGFPEFFFADGSNSNLASSKTQIVPTTKKFEDRQGIWQDFMMKLYSFVLDVALEIGEVDGLDLEPDFEEEFFWDFDIQFPPILLLDQKDVAASNKSAIGDGYMSKATAAARMGLDFENEKMLIEEEGGQQGGELPGQGSEEVEGTNEETDEEEEDDQDETEDDEE